MNTWAEIIFPNLRCASFTAKQHCVPLWINGKDNLIIKQFLKKNKICNFFKGGLEPLSAP